MLMCFKSRFWPAARPLRRLTIMALAQAAILASSLNLSEACLSSQLRESSANRPPPHTHYATGSFPGKDCELLIACFTINMAHAYTRKCETGIYAWQVVWASRATFSDIIKTSNTERQSLTKAFHAHYHVSTSTVVWRDSPDISLNRKFNVSILRGMKHSLICEQK